MPETTMSRLSIELNPEQHKQIKTLATLSGLSIRSFVLNKIFENKEPKQKITNELAALHNIRAALSDEEAEDLKKELAANRSRIKKRFAKTRKLTQC